MCFQNGIVTNAMTFMQSPLNNLNDINSNIGMDQLITAVGKEYLRTNALVLEDGGHKLFEQQRGFQFINPTKCWFPGTYQNALHKKKMYITENRRYMINKIKQS